MSVKWKKSLLILGGVVLAAWAGYRSFFYAPPVEVVHVKEGIVKSEVRAPATVQARIPVTVSVRLTGILKEVYADQGDSVRAGQLLAILDNSDVAAKAASVAESANAALRNLDAAQALIAKAKADRELAQSNFKRNVELSRSGFISQAALDVFAATLKAAESGEASAIAAAAARQAESRAMTQETAYARTQLGFTRIVAPMDGLVISREAEVGTTVVPGTPVFRMVDPQTVWVAAHVDESAMGAVRLAQTATITLRNGHQLAGKVARIARQSDPSTRELEVDIAFDTLPRHFAIGQEAEVAIATGEEKGVMIPKSALLHEQGVPGVLVMENGGKRFRPIKPGAMDGKHIAVREGLAVGEPVVRNPNGAQSGGHGGQSGHTPDKGH